MYWKSGQKTQKSFCVFLLQFTYMPLSKKSLDDKITKAKEKIDAFKKNKEIIAEFKESKGVKWLDIGEKLFEFREILKKEKKSKNVHYCGQAISCYAIERWRAISRTR